MIVVPFMGTEPFLWAFSDKGFLPLAKTYSNLDQGPTEGYVGSLQIKGVNHLKISAKPSNIKLDQSAGANNASVKDTTYKLIDGSIIADHMFDVGPSLINVSREHYFVASGIYHGGCATDVYWENVQQGNGLVRNWYRYEKDSDKWTRFSIEHHTFLLDTIELEDNKVRCQMKIETEDFDTGETDTRIRNVVFLITTAVAEIPDPSIFELEIRRIFRSATMESGQNSILDLYNQNIERVIDHIDSNATNNLESIGDLLSLIKGLRNPSGISSSIKGFGKRCKQVFSKDGKSCLEKAYKLYADASMTYKWSLEPLPEDVMNTLNGIAQHFSDIKSPKYERETFSSSGSVSITHSHKQVPVKTSVTTTVYREPTKPSLLESLGLDISCTQVWEALPLSFIVDMLFNVKDYLQQGEYADKAMSLSRSIVGVCCSTKMAVTLELGNNLVSATYYSRQFDESLDYSGTVMTSHMKLGLAAKTLFDIFS